MSFTESAFGVVVKLEIIATIWKCDLSKSNVMASLNWYNCFGSVTCLPMVGMVSFGYWWLVDSAGSPASFGCKTFNQLYILL